MGVVDDCVPTVNDSTSERSDQSGLSFPVVGIGSSAGGLKGLIDFFTRARADAGMAYVVVSHLSPDHESRLPELLQKVTAMPVVQVTQREAIKPNSVYVISPKSDLSMHDGHLDPSPNKRREMTIDRFFATLGEAHGNRAFAIVLSGTGSDGTLGAKAVRAAGGVTLAQEPDEAEYDTMPRNAIGAGAIDFVLGAGDMPGRIVTLWRNAQAIELPQLEDKPTPEDLVARAEDALRDILAIVRARTGHDFSQYKRATLLRRLERRLQVNQLRDLPAYRDLIRENPGESRLLLRDLLISVTSFFRDPAAFAALENHVMPQLFAGKSNGKIRAWVAGCATGEEAYSIAMLLAEQAQQLPAPVEVSVFATDIDEDALAVARSAFYTESIRDQVSPERLRRFFTQETGGYRVQKPLREMVMFATHNVIQDPPFSRLDLISCRNLLIYLNRHVQDKVLDLLHFSLRPEGYLLLGQAESVDENNDRFAVVDKTHRIYQQQPRARMGMLVNSLPAMAPSRGAEMPPAAGRRLVSYGELHQNLLEHYAPPSVVVDDRYDIVHLSEHAGRFLQLGGGEPSANLLRVVPDSLRYELRAALDEAMQTMRTVERRDVPLARGPQLLHLAITVHPVREKSTRRMFALVVFDELRASLHEAGFGAEGTAPAGDSPNEQLEARLVETQAQLRAAVEQYEVQNEELKASNEELQATNEELRATSEELETGKEELQSINEELITVNQELKNKVDETTRISDDLQNFMTSTEIAVLFVDRDMRLMRFTPYAREIFNVIPGDIGRSLLDVTHKLENASLQEDIASVYQALRAVERELRASNGRWYILRMLPYRTADDRIAGAVLTFVDITRRKRAEEELLHRGTWLELIVDSVTDYAIMTLGPDGRIKTWNPGAATAFGYSAEEIKGEHFSKLFVDEDRAAGVPEHELRSARANGRAGDDRWMQRKDGARFFASGVTAPLLDVGYVKLLRDLTAERLDAQRREELLAAEQATRASAEEAMRLKDEFIATLSHELRNPLALILMQSELLQRSKEVQKNTRLRGAVDVINRMVRAQSQFVEDMLDVSRARTGKLAISRQLLPLPYIIADSIGAITREARENDITIDVHIADEPLIVAADAVRVRQIAWNLMSNAVKFTPRGGTVTVALTREGNEARLDVSDTGQGIEPDQLPRIFDWFRRGEAGSKRSQGGLGIGLALVKQLVELQGGRVAAESKGIGKGARFTVWLPLQQAESVHVLNVGPVSATAGQRLKGLRVLVIDDAQANAEALCDLLKLEGAETTMETTAGGAIERSRTQAFDVIVSDLAMPRMDGYEMLQQIRAGTLNAATPAVAYSGYGGPEEMARSKAAGFDLHITKPIDLPRMIDAINSLRPQAPDGARPS